MNKYKIRLNDLVKAAEKVKNEITDFNFILTKSDYNELLKWEKEIIERERKCKELEEKSTLKKPIYEDFEENENGEIVPGVAKCPNCGYEFEFGKWNEIDSHHCICGQKLDWSE